MSLRHYYPWRVNPSYPLCGFDDEFDTFPFSSLVPSWRQNRRSNPFGDFQRLRSNRGAEKRQQASSNQFESGEVVGHASDNQNFVYNFDLRGFDSKDVKVKTVGQKVIVEAESEENEHQEGCHTFCHRHYHRSLVLPTNVKPESVTSTMTDKGILRISSPLLAISGPKEVEREIAVQQEKMEEDSNPAVSSDS